MFKAFQASSPKVEVDGSTVVAVTSGIIVGAVARELLSAAGLADVHQGGWYPHQLWLNVYRSIHDHLGADTLYSIGRRIPYSADFPAQRMVDVATALAAIDAAYQTAHRGGDIGEYRFVEVGQDHYEIRCDNPYPNEFDLGIVTSIVELYRGRNQYQIQFASRPTDPLIDNACVIEIARQF
jgi:hypothetical protein